MAEEFKDVTTKIAEGARAKKPIATSGTADTASLPDIVKNFQDTLGTALKKGGKDSEEHLSKSMQAFKSAFTGGAKGINEGIKIAVAELVKAGAGLGKALGPAIGALVSAVLEVISKGNALWAGMFSGNIEGAMKHMNHVMMEAVGGMKSPMGKALGGFIDNVISSMMFRFEEGLKYREGRIAAEAQLGVGSEQATKYAGGEEAGKMKAYMGRDKAAETLGAFAGVGFAGYTEEMYKMVGAGKQMGMDTAAAAEAMNNYASFGNSAEDSVTKMSENWRKLQAATQGTNIPVKLLEKGIRDASTAARFLNVDVAQVGNMMSNVAKDSEKMSKFGVDMRLHSGSIAKDLATGGSKMNDAMLAYYGSNMGKTGDVVGGWIKGLYGAGAEVKELAGGGFEMQGGGGDEKSMLQQRLNMQKQMMVDSAKGAATEKDRFFMQVQFGMKTLGLSREAATTMAAATQEKVSTLADSPAMANAFKSTDKILQETATSAALSEQLQRVLVSIQMNALKEALRVPTYFSNLAKSFGKGKEAEEAKKELAKSAGGAFEEFGAQFQAIGGLIQSVDPETFGMLGHVLSEAKKTKIGDKEINYGAAEGLVKAAEARYQADVATRAKQAPGKQHGGPVDRGKPYTIGERGKELLIPDTSGTIIPNDKLAGIGGGNPASPVNLNVHVSGATIDNIMNEIRREVVRNIGS